MYYIAAINISVRIVSVIYSLKMSACCNNPIISFSYRCCCDLGLVVLAVILASYGTVITNFSIKGTKDTS